MTLHQIQASVHERSSAIAAAHPEWPCRKGCDDCCRSLASVPLITAAEWSLITDAIDALPSETRAAARNRIAAAANAQRPVVCPLLDTSSGACLVYHARPVACRAYGFYAERQSVLGCRRIEAIAEDSAGVVWGNHLALEERLSSLGESAPLDAWLARSKSNPAPALLPKDN